MESVHIPITFENFFHLTRRVRRKFFRAYLKKNKVPSPRFVAKVSDRRNFKRLNYLTLLGDLKAEMHGALPRMDVFGQWIK